MSHRANQPSPQRIHDSFLLVPSVVPTELLDLRGGKVVEAKGIHPLLGPLRYNSNDSNEREEVPAKEHYKGYLTDYDVPRQKAVLFWPLCHSNLKV